MSQVLKENLTALKFHIYALSTKVKKKTLAVKSFLLAKWSIEPARLSPVSAV